TFVTRKITRAATRIKLGLQDKLYLGNLDAKRDWGYAGDYVEAMWLILQQDKPDDFVIATGESHSVREFVEEVFGYLNMDWHKYVEVDPKYFRPTEVDTLQGDATKAAKVLGWKPKVVFRELARMMTDADMKIAEHEKIIAEHDRKQ
ncbi:MAG: GDP-mannose 4,6-dehydratase, partial [Sedimentisphaerales bacterium]